MVVKMSHRLTKLMIHRGECLHACEQKLLACEHKVLESPLVKKTTIFVNYSSMAMTECFLECWYALWPSAYHLA